MAAAYFTTIPCEPNAARKVQGKPYFYSACPCAIVLSTLCTLGLKLLERSRTIL